MGFLSKIASGIFGEDVGDAITNQAGKDAATESGRLQQQEANLQAENIGVAGETAISRFDPLNQVGQQGFNQASFLTDPSQQAAFVQNNPLFQLGVDNLNRVAQNSSAASGRLSSGDTLLRLQNNATLAAQPLIQDRKQSIIDLLGFGERAIGGQANIGLQTAGGVADLRTSGAAAQAAGVVGRANAKNEGIGNIFDIASMFAGG